MEHGVLLHTTKQLSKQITYDCGVFIPVFIGAGIIKIEKEVRELCRK